MSLEHILNKKQPRTIYDTSLTEIKEDQSARKWKHEEEVSDFDWKGMEEQLEKYRKSNNWWYFADQASNMRIISAYKVEVFKQGIKITDEPPKPLFVSPSRPVRRKI